MLFKFSLDLSSSSSGLTLHIHLTILVSILSNLITFSSLSGQVSLAYSITLRTHAEYMLPFGKPLLANIGNRSLNLHHPPLILVITLSNAPHQAHIVPQFQETDRLVLCLNNPLLDLFADFHMSEI